MIDFCKSQDWTIVARTYVDDGYSGASLDRPALQQLLEDIKTGHLGIEVVVSYRLDRLTRDIRDLHALLETFGAYGVKYRSVTEPYDTTTSTGRLFLNIVASMAQWERERFAERSAEGKEQRARKGWWKGGPVTYGYRYDPEVAPHLLIEPTEAQVVRRIFQLYTEMDLGYEAIARLLNAEGVPAPGAPRRGGGRRGGTKWYLATVRKIVQNPIYAGWMPYREVLFDGAHEGIVSKEQFKAAERKRLQRQENQRAPQQRSLLSGLLVCAECGGGMRKKRSLKNWREVVQRRTQRQKRYVDYYVCYNYLGSPSHLVTGDCDSGYRRCEVVEANVLAALREYALHPENIDAAVRQFLQATDQSKAEALQRDAAMEKLRGDIAALRRNIIWYFEQFEARAADWDLVRPRLEQLQDELKRKQKQLEFLEREPARQERMERHVQELKAALSELESQVVV